MNQISGHLVGRIVAPDVDWHRHVHDVVQAVFAPVFGGGGDRLPLLLVDFALFAVEVEDVLGGAEFDAKLLGRSLDGPLFLIDEVDEMFAFLGIG